jgi:heat shock protein HslJ
MRSANERIAAMKFARIIGLVCLLAQPAIAGAAGLEGSEWRPIDHADKHGAGKARLFVRFEAGGRLAGYGGCNHFFGGYETHGDRIHIGAMGMSMMACEPAIAEREGRFVKALESARYFHRGRHRLVLFTSPRKTPVLRLIQTDWD